MMFKILKAMSYITVGCNYIIPVKYDNMWLSIYLVYNKKKHISENMYVMNLFILTSELHFVFLKCRAYYSVR